MADTCQRTSGSKLGEGRDYFHSKGVQSNLENVNKEMFVYLAHRASRVVLPKAIRMESNSPDSPEVRFLDGQGNVIAIFQRADVAVVSDKDLGESLMELPTDNE